MEKYEDLVIIGQGQYGTAFRARDKYDGHLYCIKRIPMSAKDDHAGALRESQLLDSLDHPNIIRYRESFVDKDGALCIVTSFCEEGDLFTRIRKKASQKEYFTEEEVMNMFVQIASALSYIHSKRVLHRDLKTQNIFIARGGIIKLGDFGISKVLERTDSFATTVTGTPYYMAPEICTNQPYTYKSDIWSLGCVLYELCTLKHAFAADSLLSLVYQIVRGNFPPIPTDQFSSGLSDLVNRLLARDATTRPSLGEVFKMPYVQRHLGRFKAEEQQRNMKQSISLTRRKQLLDAAPGAEAYGENDANLTPKQRMERKKAMEREKEMRRMSVAAMGANKNRVQAAARKREQIFGNNTGLPGAQPSPQRVDRGFEDDDLPNMGTVRIEETVRGPPTRPGNKGIWVLDGPDSGAVDPYAATLPSQARLQQQQGAGQRPPSQQAPSRGLSAGGAGRVGTSPASQQFQTPTLGNNRAAGGGTNNWGLGDDDVLTGTVRGGATQVGLQATAGALEQGARGGAGQWGMDYNGASVLGDDMPNMGTVQMTNGYGMQGAAARGLYTAGLRTNASDSPLMGSVNLGNSRTMRATSAGPVGLSGAGSPARPPNGTASDRSIMSSKSVGAATPSPDVRRTSGPSPLAAPASAGARGHQQPQAQSPPPLHGGGARHHHHHGDDDDDGAYSDDFEDDDEDEGVVQQRNRIIQNVEDIASRAYDGRDSIAAVQERVKQTGANSDKARAIRQGCEAQLGNKFAPVYEYLSRARRQEPPPDEKEVQRRLLEIVGDKARMPGCFMVDQLVFTESMYS
ncbi:NimA-related protein kinase 5 [Volvox carteri f. nagariensis]|uniref:non-specific serine/threonine protein kinase n=1 Tax=Volvox carteri f. nagariensis TaxID=3068 RepID=D8U242_VOLCA|nr:NimA-related protein kinase 5 [Volvox carteri f. nagariensis]EFJ46297.1 NimA-related protein kinase 5 [Volvox carteri f. nagariensis]|eukprot:XP_002952744.1 NimA-related protein kinase 5 [Volvox carteri f. nagariensis]